MQNQAEIPDCSPAAVIRCALFRFRATISKVVCMVFVVHLKIYILSQWLAQYQIVCIFLCLFAFFFYFFLLLLLLLLFFMCLFVFFCIHYCWRGGGIGGLVGGCVNLWIAFKCQTGQLSKETFIHYNATHPNTERCPPSPQVG